MPLMPQATQIHRHRGLVVRGRALCLAAAVLASCAAAAFAQAPPAAAPANANAYYDFLIARHLEGEGDTAAALAALQRAAAEEPASAEVRAEIASFQFRRNQRDEAEKAANAALAIDANNPEANRVLGLINAANADNERNTPAQIATYVTEAIAHLEKVVGTSQGSTDANLNYTLGRLYLRAGASDRAIQALGRVVDQNPGSVQARLSLAQAQAAAKNLKGAIATLEEIVDDEPRVSGALGQYQQQAGLYPQAVDSYTKALALQPTSREIKVRRIVALYDAKDYTRAAAFASDAEKQHPDDPRFPRLQASALNAAGDRAGAIDVLESLTRTFPKDTVSQLALADMYTRAGRKADAERTARQLLTADPNNADAMNYLGYMLADRGEKLDEAIRLVQRALEIDPDNGAFLDSLGWAYFRKGNIPEAEKYLSAAAEKLPSNSDVQDHLGDVLARRGRWPDAIAAWTRALGGDGPEADRPAIEKKIGNAKSKMQNAK
jgi:tetratricopeptide (TPR) repeat protein